MSEEEIIKNMKEDIDRLNDMIYRSEVDKFYEWFNMNEVKEKVKKYQGLLDLYNKEKEKNKELEKLNLTETTLYADGKIINKTIQLEDYISKDKIREKIKELENEIEIKSLYEENWNKIEVLQELLEEE